MDSRLLSERIRKTRKTLGWTTTDLSHKTGLSPREVRRIEADPAAADAFDLAHLLEVLDLAPSGLPTETEALKRRRREWEAFLAAEPTLREPARVPAREGTAPALLDVCALLTRLTKPHAVIGDLLNGRAGLSAVGPYISVCAHFHERYRLDFLAAVLKTFPPLAPDPAAFFEATSVIPVAAAGRRVDIHCGASHFEREAIRHGIPFPVGGVVLRATRPEDFLAWALLFERPEREAELRRVAWEAGLALDRQALRARVADIAHHAGRPALRGRLTALLA